VESRETVRIDNLSVNTTLAESLFRPDAFFRGVEFVSDFGKIYP
jgi:hypothetical protein